MTLPATKDEFSDLISDIGWFGGKLELGLASLI